MKKNLKLLTMVLIVALALAFTQLIAFADTEETEPNISASWSCELVGGEEFPSSSDAAVFALVSALNVDGADTEAYIEENVPYVYMTCDGNAYDKAYFVYDEERGCGVAATTLYGYGMFKGVVCANGDDTTAAAKNLDATNDSVFTLNSYDGGMRVKSSVVLDGSKVAGVWNKLTGMPNFKDVLPVNWYYKSVTYAYQKGLMTGKSSEYFEPKSEMTVIEAITLASRLNAMLCGKSIDKTTNAEEPWYQPFLNYAKENGIPYQFENYNEKISRSDFISIIYYACTTEKLIAIKDIPDGSIPDVNENTKNADKIYALYRAGIISGSDQQGNFYPDAQIERCAVATIISRLV